MLNTPQNSHYARTLTDYSCNTTEVDLHGKVQIQQTSFACAPSKCKAMCVSERYSQWSTESLPMVRGLYWYNLLISPVLSSHSFCSATSIRLGAGTLVVSLYSMIDTNPTYPRDTLLWDSQFLTLFPGTKTWHGGQGGGKAKFLVELWSQLPH